MKIRSSVLFLLLLLVSCQSKQVAKSGSDNGQAAIAKSQPTNALPVNFKFSLYISAAGLNDKPLDSWTIDTNGTIAIHTSRRISRGKYQDQNAVATLDPQDLDSLRMLIRMGKLYSIDSNNLNQQCAGDEHYIVEIVPLAALPNLSVSFDACAADYNLLIEPQRRYFRLFIDWWERMRVKYRPNKLE
jgi:hypothetical protein